MTAGRCLICKVETTKDKLGLWVILHLPDCPEHPANLKDEEAYQDKEKK